MSHDNSFSGTEIAVVGMTGRFPGARDLDAFWSNLLEGRESIRFFSRDELMASGVRESVLSDPNYVPARGVLGEVDRFDASFFGYSPKEAAMLDPQQRLFLETAWQALECAGHDPRRLKGRAGVFASVGFNTYLLLNLEVQSDFMNSEHGPQAMLSNDKDFLATRVAYKLGLTGPAVVVQSACSSSLVAIHTACQSLLSGDSDLALAGGITLRVPECSGHIYQEGMINSMDGHCRPFDKDATGTVAGNGVGVVVLKRLEDALHDRDHIHAVIRGTAINNDGDAKVGYAAPSASGQAHVIELAQSVAGVNAGSVGYIEAHGSGTRMGDPIEIEALRQAFRKTTDAVEYCAIGSVKANIGHLDAAAGVAGFIRAALAVENGVIPPNANYRESNPLCQFNGSPFFVPKTATAWPALGPTRRAGVSSFGMGGTNTHVVIEQAPQRAPSGPSREWQLLGVSAKTSRSLDRAKDGLRNDLESLHNTPLADIAWSLHMGRQSFAHACCVIARTPAEALSGLSAGHNDRVHNAAWDGKERAITFMFSGQGAQFSGMGRELYRREASFAADVDACAAILEPIIGCRIVDIMLAGDDSPDLQAKLNETAFTQPALFVIEYALARLLIRWGVKPAALIGHSIGEYVAACIAEVFTLEDALRLVAHRGRLIQSLPAGAMLLVPQSAAEVEPWLSDQVALAVVNAPAISILSGPTAAIDTVAAALEAQGVRVKHLRTSHAFHSPMMTPILEPFRALFAGLNLRAPQIPIMSNLTGDWMTPQQATDPDYWVRHLASTVRFAKGIEKLSNGEPRLFVEVGPGDGLAQFARHTIGRESTHQVDALLTRSRDADLDDAQFQCLSALGRIWSRGVAVDWSAFYAGQTRNRIPLSPYPFHGESYWVSGLGDEQTKRTSADSPASALWTDAWTRVVVCPTSAQRADGPHPWLCVDAGGFASSLLPAFAAAATEAVLVTSTTAVDSDARALRIDMSDAAAWRGLIDVQCDALGEQPLRLLYTLADSDSGTGDALVQTHAMVKALVQRLGERSGAAEVTLVVRGAARIVGTEPAANWCAAAVERLLAAAHALQPALCWRVIDCGAPIVSTASRPGLLGRLFARGERTQAAVLDADAGTLLAADWGRFVHASALAYRNGQRWQRRLTAIDEDAAAAAAAAINTTPPAHVLVYGPVDALAESLILGWYARHGTRFVLLDARPDDADASEAVQRDARRLQAVGVAHEILQTADRAAFGARMSALSKAGSVVLWSFVDAKPAEVEEILVYLQPADLRAIIGGAAALADGLSQLPVTHSVWFAPTGARFGHPPLLLAALADARLQAVSARPQQRYLHWDPLSLRADTAEDRARLCLLIESAISGVSGAEPVWLSTDREHAYWQPAVPASIAESEDADGTPAQNKYRRPDLSAPYAAPVTERQKIICAIWQALFEIDRVGVHDNFFDLGGDSIMALKLLSALETEFRVALPLSEVFNSPTVADQANAVFEYTEVPMEQRKLSPLVALQKDGTRPPFFCAHPAGGIVHCYIEMARCLGKEQPFYAFQHPGIDGKSGPYTSYAKMAELYVDAMMEIQPNGPYYIGGWSFGGTVAFEMARQVRLRGEEVGMLALFDTPGPSALYKLGDRPEFEFAGMMTFLSQALSSMFGAQIDVPVEELRKIPREQQLDYLIDRCVTISGDSDLGESKEALERIIDIFELTDKGERQFVPQRYQGRVHMYRVQEMADYEFTAYKNHPRIAAASFGWDELVDDLVVRFVPGTHMSMIFPPNTEALMGKFGEDLLATMDQHESVEA